MSNPRPHTDRLTARETHADLERLIVVIGVDEDGSELSRHELGHGEAPAEALAASGWAVGSPVDARRGEGGWTEIRLMVRDAAEPLPEGAHTRTAGHALTAVAAAVGAAGVSRDADITDEEAAAALRRQRLAAYAVVTSACGVLLTQFSGRTHVEGLWGLPGGGVDPGEEPPASVLREIHEETGQSVELGPLVDVQSQHWIGRAPDGHVEDFQAVRLVHTARCPQPSEPVIHDVDGTTSDARWFGPDDELPPLASAWATEEMVALIEAARRA